LLDSISQFVALEEFGDCDTSCDFDVTCLFIVQKKRKEKEKENKIPIKSENKRKRK